MANNIKGLTVEIGGDTTKLGKALEGVNKKSRDLSSELGQINKLLKMDPGNTELLAQKQKVLAEAIANTSNKLKTLREAEKQVQQQFKRGEVSEEQVRALQREIVQTEQKMESYQRAAKETAYDTKKVGNAADEAGNKTGKFGDKLKAAGKVAATGMAAVAAAAAAAATALAKASMEAAAYADNILTASTVTGISTDKLQAYAYAAELVDVSVDTLTKSHAKNIKSMKAVQDGTKLAVEAYEKLGVTVTNADGSLRDGETVYWEVIDALGKMENETERDALAMQILGKSAQELNPLIEAGSQKMNELAQEAKDVGAVLSEDSLNAMGAFDDSIQRLKGSAGAAKNALGSVLLPELTALTTDGAALLSEFTTTLNESGGGLEGFVVAVEKMGPKVASKAADLLGGIVIKAAELIPMITSVSVDLVVTAASAILEQLPTLVQSIVGALNASAPKLHDGALDLLMAIVAAIEELIPMVIEVVPDIVICIVEVLTAPKTIKTLIDGTLRLLLVVCDAIPLLIEKLVPLIPSIVLAITDALLTATPKLLAASLKLFTAITLSVPKACASLLKALPQIWSTISSYIKQLPSKMQSMGGDLISGLWQGMNNKTAWIKSKIQSWVGNVTSFLKKLFGINSPSKVTAYMGEMLDEGLAVGIEDNADAPKKAMGDLSADVINAAGHVDGMAVERQITHSFSVEAAAAATQNASMIGKLDQILEAIKRGQILTIDGKALVGATANNMNTALGQRRVLAERGAV